MNSKSAYQYDFAGLYTGETVADESPLEPGVYHIPASCTLTPPPVGVPAGKWPRWNGAAWDLVNRPTPENDNTPDPVAKLREFLAANPDVAALLNNDGGANV